MIRKKRELPTSWRPRSHVDLLPHLVRLAFIHPPSYTSARGPPGPALTRGHSQPWADGVTRRRQTTNMGRFKL